MRLLIISNGPSATAADEMDLGAFDFVAGVNWTVSRWPCSHWVIRDTKTFAGIVPIGRPILFASQNVRKLETWDPAAYAILQAWPTIWHSDVHLPTPAGGTPWNNWSGVAAMGLAVAIDGIQEVHIVGADMDGDKDFRGEEGASRYESRWKDERSVFARNKRFLEGRGIKVFRRLAAHG